MTIFSHLFNFVLKLSVLYFKPYNTQLTSKAVLIKELSIVRHIIIVLSLITLTSTIYN